MSESTHIVQDAGQSPSSLTIEALEEIVRNCQRNEERLHELERHTRHERKKAERLLRETYRTMQNRDSENSDILENHIDKQNLKHQPTREFFVPLDDENEENANHKHQQNQNSNNNNNNNKTRSQDKHLLHRIEKLLAGDGTTTSSDVMSSQERQTKVVKESTTPIEDEFDEKLVKTTKSNLPEPRQLPSACSIEGELSAVDRLLSEHTPTNSHRTKSEKHLNENNYSKKTVSYKDDIPKLSDERDQQFYERLNNYVHTGRFVSPEPDDEMKRIDDKSYKYSSRSTSRISNRDEELTDLARRCEDLLARLQTQRNRSVILENSYHHDDYHRRHASPISSSYESKYNNRHSRAKSASPLVTIPSEPPQMSLQQALELLRPEFISRSRQRARRVRLLREEREHNAEIDRERRQMLLFSCETCCAHPATRSISTPPVRRNISYIIPHDRPDSSRMPVTYHQMKRATKKKYNQLPEVNDRRRQSQMEEFRRRNLLRAKVFRARLRQHVVRQGRTNIDESLTMIDT